MGKPGSSWARRSPARTPRTGTRARPATGSTLRSRRDGSRARHSRLARWLAGTRPRLGALAGVAGAARAMVKRFGWLLLLALCAAAPAWAKGWDPLGYTLRMNAFGTSDAFPGSINSGPDHGLEPMAVVASGLRLSKAVKLGVSASAGGNVQSELTRANYGWL